MDRSQDKLDWVRRRLAGRGGLLVAFSGGVDSSALLDLALEAHDGPVLAVTVTSALQPEGEDEAAAAVAADLGASHRFLELDVLADESIRPNDRQRCYHCKRRILTALNELARTEGLSEVIEGSNLDDDGDDRPGKRAVAELGVGSPLHQAGLLKSELRRFARERGLRVWDKPALACLASRIPYGEPLELKRLRRVDRAEAILRREGFAEVRLRDHGEIARIEVPAKRIAALVELSLRWRLVAELTALGYTYVAVDLVGYRTGAMNEAPAEGGGPSSS